MFCSSIIDFHLIRIDSASYSNGYCSLMFFMHVFNVFISEKHDVFIMFFYLQINVFNIYAQELSLNI